MRWSRELAINEGDVSRENEMNVLFKWWTFLPSIAQLTTPSGHAQPTMPHFALTNWRSNAQNENLSFTSICLYISHFAFSPSTAFRQLTLYKTFENQFTDFGLLLQLSVILIRNLTLNSRIYDGENQARYTTKYRLRSFPWNRTYTEMFVKLCLLIVYVIGT